MSKYSGPVRYRVEKDTPPEYLAYGRQLLGDVIQAASFNNLQIHERTVVLPDGVIVRAQYNQTLPFIEITLPDVSSPDESTGAYNLWIPRGFVVYPAFGSAPAGYGLPPTDPTKLNPGLAISAWTAGGPCGEVLISPDVNAGYPQNRIPVPVPLLYQPNAGPTFQWVGDGSFDDRRLLAPWTSYRIEFDAFIKRHDDEIPANQTALLTALNVARSAAHVTLTLPSPRGYAHPAQIMASIMRTAGSVDESNPAYPLTYFTSADRLTKEGYPSLFYNGSFTDFSRAAVTGTYEFRTVGGSATDAIVGWGAGVNTDIGPSAFADVGYRGGYWCLNLTTHDRWIEAGNCHWQSSDPSLPIVSWHGFASVNLAWETYPATFNVGNPTTPLTVVYTFTSTFGDCWLNYTRLPNATASAAEPGMSRHIYWRGRVVALAPNGGLVWGASIIRDGGVDYLTALIHHPEDQPVDYTTNGFTRYLRVWSCALPSRAHLRAAPPRVICGTDPADPYGWKGGSQIDVGHMPPPSTGGTIDPGVTSSLKMYSQWKFSPDGRKAICLRDFGLYAGYADLQTVVGVETQYGLIPRAVELIFHISGGVAVANPIFYDYPSGLHAPFRPIDHIPGTTDPIPGTLYEGPVTPMAVDYDASGNIIYAYLGYLYPTGSTAFEPIYTYAGIGRFDTQYPTQLQYLALQGARQKTASVDFNATNVMVTNVREGVFTTEGVHPRIDIDGNPVATDCYPFTVEPVHGVRMSRHGTNLRLDWFGCADGVVFSLGNVCDNSIGSTTVFVELPLAMSRTCQSYYAERFGQFIYSNVVAPVPLAVLALNDLPDDPICGCRLEIHQVVDDSHTLTYAEVAPRGGHTVSQVPLPQADWLIYTKVV